MSYPTAQQMQMAAYRQAQSQAFAQSQRSRQRLAARQQMRLQQGMQTASLHSASEPLVSSDNPKAVFAMNRGNEAARKGRVGDARKYYARVVRLAPETAIAAQADTLMANLIR